MGGDEQEDEQGTIAVTLTTAILAFVTPPSGEANLITDIAVLIYTAVFIATPPLTIAGSVLLIAAFGAGLGNPKAAEPETPRLELEPLPNPG